MLGESVRRRQPGGSRPVSGPRPPRERGRWRPLWIALPIALVLPFAIGYLVAVYVIFPPPPVEAAGVPVPDLVGRSSEDAQRQVAGLGLGPIEASELPHPTAPAGQVIAQSPLPGQQLRAGAPVLVAISSGRARGVVPDVTGFSAERAESLLRQAGFDVTVAVQESAAAAGRVVRTEPAPGQELPLPAAITLVVSAGPPPVTEPDTIFGEAPVRDQGGPRPDGPAQPPR
jgi:beta-lactam-binding protein with PASTA domain